MAEYVTIIIIPKAVQYKKNILFNEKEAMADSFRASEVRPTFASLVITSCAF